MKKERNVLLITYYWPPGSGAGVHRWLRFSKYFKENGWNLTVYCPKDAGWSITDKNLSKKTPKEINVIRRKIFEPHTYFQKKSGLDEGAGLGGDKKKSWLKNLLIWIRGNLFIPDARVFWIRPSYRFLKKYLRHHPEITHIISTGPPHSTHVIADKLVKKITRLKWIADFRDPWTEIDYYEELRIGKWADKRQKRMEKSVLQSADLVVTVSQDCATGLKRIGGRNVEIITNGYDFPKFDEGAIQFDSKFSIAHFGSMGTSRNPTVLWNALSELLIETPDLKDYLQINLIGSVDYSIIESMKENNLIQYFSGEKKVNHNASISLQRTSQILLLIVNKTQNTKGILTGKFFEYLGAKRPILVIGAKGGDLERIVAQTNCGIFIDYDEKNATKRFLKESFTQFKNGALKQEIKNIDQFHSEFLAKKYFDLIDKIDDHLKS